MQSNYLVDHAIKNIWCTPRQDLQVILKPAMVTKRTGALKSFELMWRDVRLPDAVNRWYVYQIGGTAPIAFNLFGEYYDWVKFSRAAEDRSMMVNIYTANGYSLPLEECYSVYTADNNLLVAVPVLTQFPVNLADEQVYFRFYSNAYFRSPASSHLSEKIRVLGEAVASSGVRDSLRDFYEQYEQEEGHVFLYVNGVLLNEWNDDNVPLNSYVEMVYDASVKKTISLSVSELRTFQSTLDAKHKYILHYAGADDGMIDYQDDIDLYVGYPDEEDAFRSLWYNKNSVDAMRNLTHRDYSIAADYVKTLSSTLTNVYERETELDPLDTTVFMYIRHSGYARPLVYEASRIQELYKMEDEDILGAMSGPMSTVEVWQAANLEAAGYPEVMGTKYCDITAEMVERAYGYNAIAKYTADTPKQVHNNNGAYGVDVPFRLQFGCTAYEYDNNGIMTGYYHHYVGPFYTRVSSTTKYVELIAGIGSPYLQEYPGQTEVQFDPNFDYRVYQTSVIGGQIGTEWQDVTNTDKYTVEGNEFTWTDESVTAYPMLRTNKRFLTMDLELRTTDGALYFSLQQEQATASGTFRKTLQVPMAQIDVFVNGRSLVRNLDYYVDFPVVYIVSKEYLLRPINSSEQQVHVRFAGLSKDMEILGDGNAGFIEHGLLSNNNKFDLRDDKVLRITVGGRLYTREELSFSETTSGVSVVNALNGKPYMVKDILVPTGKDTPHETHYLRDKALETDYQVSNYLTIKIPEPERAAPSAIPNKYQLYSPFCNKLIMDLVYGRLTIPNKPNGLTRQEVLEICKPYEWLLAFDPAYNEQDWKYVVVHPHAKDSVMDISERNYQFLLQVVLYYMKDKVELSQLLRIN